MGFIAGDGVFRMSSCSPTVVAADAVEFPVDVDDIEIAAREFMGMGGLFQVGQCEGPDAYTERLGTDNL